ncbi:MAG: hypothetical protein ACXVDG_10400 [Tumebacillaceae bacterium]
MKSNAINWKQWTGAVFLFVVAYVHLALFFAMMSARLLPILFLLNGVGALVAMVGVLMNARWFGWINGIVQSGGAAFAKLAMNSIPGFGALLMGGGMKRPAGGAGKGFGGAPGAGGGAGHAPVAGHPAGAGGGGMHGILPMFTDIQTLATISIAIELLFVVFAIAVMISNRKKSQFSKPVTA